MIVRKKGDGIVALSFPVSVGEKPVCNARAYELGLISDYSGKIYHEGKMYCEVSTHRKLSVKEKQDKAKVMIISAFPELADKGSFMGGYLTVDVDKLPKEILKLVGK